MRRLSRTEDPTGYLDLFRLVASDRFGDPSGVIHARGKYQHRCKAGPGRRHEGPWRGSSRHGAKWLNPNVMRRGR